IETTSHHLESALDEVRSGVKKDIPFEHFLKATHFLQDSLANIGKVGKELPAPEEFLVPPKSVSVEETAEVPVNAGLAVDTNTALAADDNDEVKIKKIEGIQARLLDLHSAQPSSDEKKVADINELLELLAPIQQKPEKLSANVAAYLQKKIDLLLSTNESAPVEMVPETAPQAPIPETATQETETRKDTAPAPGNEGTTSNFEVPKTVSNYVRIPVEKLDQMFALVGELLTAEAMVTHHPDLAKVKTSDFLRTAERLGKICKQLQENALSLRMIPMEGLFHKVSRTLQGLTQKTEKRIQLKFTGGETEMDRNAIEELSSPLLHLVRNAFDHGIETCKERKDLNKPEAGVIAIDARYEGHEICITISDDGRGLSRKKILAKAREKKLVGEEAEGFPDQKIWKLIFEPGFSTAEKITDISGRGVGMDVVKKNIEKLGGKIDIQTKEGRGLQVSLRIPLTLALIDCFVIKVGAQHFSVPTTEVLEFQKVDASGVISFQGIPAEVRFRSETLPLVDVEKKLGLPAGEKPFSERLFVIVQSGEKRAAFVADAILGSQSIVVKSLTGMTGRTDGVKGCALLGGGQLSLILDINQLLGN
ncbi:MAG: chemotaxis protein CheA, partial [Spirochaetia bacterium]|nr:chemotaxis protein CheA [Spirochaetia bacterium]